MFIFQHPAADCAVGDLISGEKLTLQGLMLHPSEVTYMEHTLLEQERAFVIHRRGLMHGPKWLPGGSAAAKLLKVFDCSNLLCLLVITHQAVYLLQFVYDLELSLTYRTASERKRRISTSNLNKKTQNTYLLFFSFDISETDKKQPVNMCSVI